MGAGRKQHTLKMSQKKQQAKKKARVKKAIAAGKAKK